jgi:hypothetical protein
MVHGSIHATAFEVIAWLVGWEALLTPCFSLTNSRGVFPQVALFAADLDWVEAHEELTMVSTCATPLRSPISHCPALLIRAPLQGACFTSRCEYG